MCKTDKNVRISRPDSQLAISFPKFVKGREMEFEVGIPGNCGKREVPWLAHLLAAACSDALFLVVDVPVEAHFFLPPLPPFLP